MSPIVQTNIGRSNSNAENYKFQMKEYAAAGIPTYSEFILGLPGETVESFKQGMEEILELGQHTSLFVHLCEWLPLAKMAEPAYMAEFEIGYTKIPINQPHAKKSKDDITEYSRIVTSTKSMSAQEWVQMNLFSVCVLCFHHLRLLQFAALYKKKKKNIRYIDFYEDLLCYLLKNNTVFLDIRALFENIIHQQQGATMYDESFGDILWCPEEYAFLKTLMRKEEFFESIKKYLVKYFDDEELLDEILRYQSFCLKEVCKDKSPQHFTYDWKSYFESLLKGRNAQLIKKRITYALDTEIEYTDIKDYAQKVVWFGRKGGKSIYTDEIKCLSRSDL